MTTGRLSFGTHVEHPTDFGQCQPSPLRPPNKADPVDRRLVISPVAVWLPLRLWHQPTTLVEANRLGGNPTTGCKFPDVHLTTIPLDLEPWFKVYGHDVNVTLLYFDDCPNWKTADDHLRMLAKENPNMILERRIVATAEDAEATQFRGSPSIIVDGTDPFAEPDAPVGLSCRIYQTPNGPAGSPTLDQLRSAIGDAKTSPRPR